MEAPPRRNHEFSHFPLNFRRLPWKCYFLFCICLLFGARGLEENKNWKAKKNKNRKSSPNPPKSTENDPLGLLRGPIGASLRSTQAPPPENVANLSDVLVISSNVPNKCLRKSLNCPRLFFKITQIPLKCPQIPKLTPKFPFNYRKSSNGFLR